MVVAGAPIADPGAVVAISTADKGFRCGGTLIGSAVVVTAAHCVSDLPSRADPPGARPVTTERFTVRAGSVDRSAGGEVRSVAWVELYPDWTWATQSARPIADIAVLGLSTPVRDVVPARVGSPQPGRPVTVVGWGYTVAPTSAVVGGVAAMLPTPAPALPTVLDVPLPTRLHSIPMRVVDPSHCRPAAPGTQQGQACLAPDGPVGGPCFGDSGTPALQDGHIVVGIVSRGTDPVVQCGVGYAVVTDPGQYRAWITQTMTRHHQSLTDSRPVAR